MLRSNIHRFFALTAALLALVMSASALAQTSTWDQIHQRGSFRLGVAQADPWYYKDPLSGNWTGFGVLLGKAIANDMGVKLEVVPTAWSNAVAALQSGRIDVMFVLDKTPERAKSIGFIDTPLLYYALAVLHHKELKAADWSDLNSAKTNVGVTLGTSIDRFVTHTLGKANISRYPNNDNTVASFQSGRSDVVVMFAPALTMQWLRLGAGVISVPKPVQIYATSAGVRQGDTHWRDYLTKTIKTYYQSGKIEALYDRYLKSRGINPSQVPPITKQKLQNWQSTKSGR